MHSAVLDLLRKRRSIRQFLPRTVEPGKIEALIEAAVRTPTSRGRNPGNSSSSTTRTCCANSETPSKTARYFYPRLPWRSLLRQILTRVMSGLKTARSPPWSFNWLQKSSALAAAGFRSACDPMMPYPLQKASSKNFWAFLIRMQLNALSASATRQRINPVI